MTFSENLKSFAYVRLKSNNDFENVTIKIEKNVSYLCIQPLDSLDMVYDRSSFKLASLKELNLSNYKRCYRTSMMRSRRENITSLVRNKRANLQLSHYPFRIIMIQGGLLSQKKLQIAFSNEADQFYWCQALKNLIEIEKFNKASDITCDFFTPITKENELYESFSQKYAYYVTVVPTETSKEYNFGGDFLMILKDTEIIFSKEYLKRPNFCVYLRHIRNFSINERDVLTLNTGSNSTFGRGEIKLSVKNLSIDKAYNDLIGYVKSMKDEIEEQRRVSIKSQGPMRETSSCYNEISREQLNISQDPDFRAGNSSVNVNHDGSFVQLLNDTSSKTQMSSSSLDTMQNEIFPAASLSNRSSPTLFMKIDTNSAQIGIYHEMCEVLPITEPLGHESDKNYDEGEDHYSVPFLVTGEGDHFIQKSEENQEPSLNQIKDEAETPF